MTALCVLRYVMIDEESQDIIEGLTYMFITLCVVSLFATTFGPVSEIEKGEERERLKLEVPLLVEHRAGLEVIALVASREKEDLEHTLAQERVLKSLVATQPSVPLRSVGSGIVIPAIAHDHEEIYLRFLKGKLIYKQDQPDQVVLPIAQLINPLEGTLDLSRCGDTGQYLSISTGYKKAQNPANTNKTEIWLAPRFLIENEIRTSSTHFSSIMGGWQPTAPIGIFWTWGSQAPGTKNFDYLTNHSIRELSNNNLCDISERALCGRDMGRKAHQRFYSYFVYELR
jgi:hypothetical protein